MKLFAWFLMAPSAFWPSLVSAKESRSVPRSVAAGFARGRRLRSLAREEIAAGTSFIFDPPIPATAYLGDSSCSGSSIPDKVMKIENMAFGEFCITDSPTIDGVAEISYYTKLDEITCTPWGIFERYSYCTDDTCSDCTPEAVSYYELDDIMSEEEGHCYKFSYSLDPTSFIAHDLVTVGMRFDDAANSMDVDKYFNLIGTQSCIAAQVLAEAGGDDAGDEPECQTILDLLCDKAGYSVLCDLFDIWAPPELYDSTVSDVYTVFAPSDVAFAKISDQLNDGSLSDEEIRKIVLYHVTEGEVRMEDLECGETLSMTMAGESRTKCIDGDMIQAGGGNRKNDNFPKINQADIEACNGIIHLVSEVMLPNFIQENFI